MFFDFVDESLYDDYSTAKIKKNITKKGYNPCGKDKKKANLARERARLAKLSRRPR